MKKLLKCFSLAAAVLVLFAGCSNLGVNDATVDGLGASEGVKEGYCALEVSVDGLLSSGERSAARTINPTTLEGTGDSIIKKYVIKGESSTGAKLGNGAGFILGGDDAPASGTNNTVNGVDYPQYKVVIPYGSWELTLEAYGKEGETDKLLLLGKSFVELKSTKQPVHFTLKTDGVDTKGHVSLGGTFADDDNVAKTYKAGLYNTLTGLLIPGTEVKDTVTDGHKFTFAPKTTDATPVALDIAPGRYSFQIKFYNVTATTAINDSLQPIGYYEDIVVVAPGRTTSDTSIACGKIINQLPTSPDNLRAYLKNDSEDADGYTVILTWEDKSKNEENFVIYLNEYDSDAADADKKTFVLGTKGPQEGDGAVKHEIFYTSKFNAGGSVNASSETASLKLEFGKVYDVSIRAENFVGESIYTKANPDATPPVSEVQACPRDTTTEVALTGATQYTSDRINRFVIKYDLDGGVLTLGDNTKTSAKQFQYGSVYDYTTDAAKLLVVAIDPTADPADPVPAQVLHRIEDTSKLVKNGNPFDRWVKANGTEIAATDKITFAGLSVKAAYDKATLISSEIDDKYKTITASAKYDDAALTDGKVVVDTADVKTLQVIASVNVASGAAPELIDSIVVKLSGGPTSDIPVIENTLSPAVESATCDIAADTITNILAGTYTVSVTVHIKNELSSKIYELSFPIHIEK